MRGIAGLTKTCPVKFLRLETNLEPQQMRQEKNDVILWYRYRRLPEEDERNEMLRKDIPARIKTREGWRVKTKQNPEAFETPVASTTPLIPPWLNFPNLSIQATPLEKKKDDYNPEELR